MLKISEQVKEIARRGATFEIISHGSRKQIAKRSLQNSVEAIYAE